jgi:hypothetical protein
MHENAYHVPKELKRSARTYSLQDTIKHPIIIVCLADAGNMQYLIFYSYHLCIRGFNVFD